MRRVITFTFVAALLAGVGIVGATATVAKTIVLDVGDYGVVQLPPGIKGATWWLALCATPAGSELRPSSVRMRATFSEIAGDKPGQNPDARCTRQAARRRWP